MTGTHSAPAGVSAEAGEPLVQCLDVARTYGTGPSAVVAVHGANCTVHAGARIAVVGPSGSGKSTLIHLMAALDRPTAGRVTHPGLALGSRTNATWNGDTRAGGAGRRQSGNSSDILPAREIGVVFQGPSLLPPLTAVENVALPLLIDGVGGVEATERAFEALYGLGLGPLATKLPDEMSAGQAQRVAVARMLARGPRLILADEPTGRLDRETARQVLNALLDAAETLGAAVLVATHDARIAGALEERWYMSDGRLIPSAPPSRERELR
ncbi:ABC transporter ATP-binding protein [Streptomyces sp. NPDC000133]|uniref:ABC transporter ATP-binding protein n=1 Tax=Streptomyces sp. NPDC000133 TaxID=3364535 RepID=UPI0036B5086A